LGAAVGALHDWAHGKLDPRRHEVYQSIMNRLKTARAAGKNIKSLMPLATQHMVERYNTLNNTLLLYVENKERIVIDKLNAALALAPDDKNNSARKAAETLARKEYNIGIAALYETLHEQRTMNSSVFDAPTFAIAMNRLSGIPATPPAAAESSTSNPATATTKSEAEIENEKHMTEFNFLDTYFTPESDLTDEDIIDKIKDRTLASIGVYPCYEAPKDPKATYKAPTTIREYEDKFDFTTATISRGRVYTEVNFDYIFTGKRIKIQLATTRYLVNTARDENAVLGLIDQKVDESILDTVQNMYRTNALSKEAALSEIEKWYTEVNIQTKTMLSNLEADVLAHTPEGAISTYDDLVKRQDADWDDIVKPAA
jgi:hypothetical protein